MNLQEMLLKKEELPIIQETCFYIPIHPRLLELTTHLSEDIASKVFPGVAEGWYNDLSKYVETAELNIETKEWITNVFLDKKPKIIKEYGRQVLNSTWEDNVRMEPNGFVSSFSINRNVGGTLYFNQWDNSEEFISFDRPHLIKFSKEKMKEFGIKEEDLGDNIKGVVMNVYRQHNIDSYPGALFLRNWAIAYMNKAFEQVFKN